MVSDHVVGSWISGLSLLLIRIIQVLAFAGGAVLVLSGLLLAVGALSLHQPYQPFDWLLLLGPLWVFLSGMGLLGTFALLQGLAVFFEMAANQAASARAFERMAEFLAGPESPSARTDHPAP